MDVIAPQIERDSGYLRIERVGYRRGDNSEMGMISFVDTIDADFELPESTKDNESAAAKLDEKEDK